MWGWLRRGTTSGAPEPADVAAVEPFREERQRGRDGEEGKEGGMSGHWGG